jgi:dTMP kinase
VTPTGSGDLPGSPAAGPEQGSEGGLFLAFEGVEGSGKSTQSTLLADHLRSMGRGVEHAREPGSTALGERVRGLVLDEAGLGIPARSELFLMLAARAAFVEQVVRPALRRGEVVIADRFELSTLAYQGAGRGLSLEALAYCNRFATGGLSPHATLLLELPPEEGHRRQVAASKSPDRMEREDREFHRRVAEGYARFAGSVQGVVRIDGSGGIEQVQRRILEALGALFPETFARGRVIS